MADTPSTPLPAKKARDPDKYSSAGATPDPWEQCARLDYGDDRSFATAVRTQVLSAPAEQRGRIEERLLACLAAPGAKPAGVAFVCQMLALVGTAKSVPALARLIGEAATTEPARCALEAIPGNESAAALRNALTNVSGAAKAGVIGSLAERGDTAAQSALAAIKASATEPPMVRDAAARALAHLANLNANKRDAQ